MTIPVSTLDPALSSAPARSHLVRLAWLSPIAVVLSAIVWNVGAWLIDASPLEQPDYSWGVFFATAMFSFFVGIPVLATVLLAAVLVHRVSRMAKAAYLVGVAVCLLAGFAMGVLGMVVILTDDLMIDIVFGSLTLVAAALVMMPGWSVRDIVARR